MRIGHVDLNVLDINESRDYYVKIMGMDVTREDADGTLYLKCWDEWDKYSLVLRPSDEATFNKVGYKVEKDSDIDDVITSYSIHYTKLYDCPGGRVQAFCVQAGPGKGPEGLYPQQHDGRPDRNRRG